MKLPLCLDQDMNDNKLIVAKELDHDYHNFKGQFLYPRTNSSGYRFHFNGYKQTNWNDSPTVLYDMFPSTASRPWDIDRDGIGDNSDSDIDGDGSSNEDDQAPFDVKDIYDTDGDGISNSYDPNDDGDNFLDIDDPDPHEFILLLMVVQMLIWTVFQIHMKQTFLRLIQTTGTPTMMVFLMDGKCHKLITAKIGNLLSLRFQMYLS